MCDCKVGPGKFEGEGPLTFLAWQAMMDGSSDCTTGGGGDEGATDWFKHPLNLDMPEWVEAARQYGYCQPCIEECQTNVWGVAVWEDTQGFAWSAEYATKEEYERALAEAEEADAMSAEEPA